MTQAMLTGYAHCTPNQMGSKLAFVVVHLNLGFAHIKLGYKARTSSAMASYTIER
jgi:hypothetical protein